MTEHTAVNDGAEIPALTGSFMETCWCGSYWHLALVLKTTTIKACSNRRFLNHYSLPHCTILGKKCLEKYFGDKYVLVFVS